MDIIESKKIIASMMASFPNYNPDDVDITAETWSKMLSDYTYEQISVALKSYILSDKSGFAPSIGQLVDKVHTITTPQHLNEMEAWSLVSKAIRNSGYHSVEEFAKLPPLVQKAVGQPEQLRTWAIDEDYSEEVVSSHFVRCYRSELERANEISKMPVEAKRMIESVNRDRGISVKSYEAIEEARDHEGVPMPENLKERLKEI